MAVSTAGNSLLIKHFPQWLGREEKESLLQHFGAVDVVVMPTHGRMRNCVFATFSTADEAKRALSKLHQLDVCGSRLVVEFSRPAQSVAVLETEKDKWACSLIKKEEEEEEEEGSTIEQSLPEHRAVGKSQDKGTTGQALRSLPCRVSPPSPPSHSLCYHYPPPTPTSLTNITNALVCVPKLYVQLLHLMNMMNLPPPFGQLTPIPPMAVGVVDSVLSSLAQYRQPSPSPSDGDEGSEIESDEDMKRKLPKKLADARRAPKRRSISFKQLSHSMPPVKRPKENSQQEALLPALSQKKIAVIIPSDLTAKPTAATTQPQASPVAAAVAAAGEEREEGAKDGFGVFGRPAAVTHGQQEEEEGEEVTGEGAKFVSLAELRANRISEKEMREHSLFRSYSPGQASLRLYIKNLAKQTTEDDLRYVFGRYINWKVDEEKNMFDVRVMQSGKMKGQAFVGLSSESVAARALADTHGFLLHGRPMAVQFARSSRPTQSEKS